MIMDEYEEVLDAEGGLRKTMDLNKYLIQRNASSVDYLYKTYIFY